MANKYEHSNRPRVISIIGLTMVAFGATYVIMAAVLSSDIELSINYSRPILDELEGLSHDELIVTAIAGDIIFAVAGAIGIILGFGLLKMKKWAWMANAIYNIIFSLLCIDAFAENTPLPDSYLIVVSVGLLVLLFMPTTREYFRRAAITQR
jgi:hypothetical protein